MSTKQYKGRDNYTLNPGETEYYRPSRHSTKILERKQPKCKGCYSTLQPYGSSKLCSCQRSVGKEDLTGVI